jgi:hypothetical protein
LIRHAHERDIFFSCRPKGPSEGSIFFFKVVQAEGQGPSHHNNHGRLLLVSEEWRWPPRNPNVSHRPGRDQKSRAEGTAILSNYRVNGDKSENV